ncbi:DUF2157 domain-containing protein [Aestuariicella sp. G3-2]|uniref:DUF2157 domain-containing protein n=1 Tax=Pseudomaricurvus albidus TaxID=2842452 RepID=UPI001C0BE5AF|nr:DUF2157 domain-containing protein [Aestuariicella albida]
MRLIRLFKNDLAKEVSDWVEKDLISADQARSICRVYDVDYDSIQNHSLGYRLLIGLGYLFIGLAVITLLGANWDEIPRALRMGGLLLLTLATHGLAFKSYFAGSTSGAAGLFLLGNLFYGASIILIAQIYHLGEHMPDGVFWWALGSLPFGVLLKSPWLTLFSVLLAMLWFVLEFGMGFFPWLFPLFIVAAVYVLYKGPSSSMLFLATIAAIGLWIEAVLSALWAGDRYDYTLHLEHLLVSVALFVLAYAVSGWLYAQSSNKAKDYGVLLSLWSLRFGLVALLVFSFEDPWSDLIESDWDQQASMWLCVVVLMAASLWFAWRGRILQFLLPVAVFAGLSMIAVVAAEDRSAAVYFQIAYNIALICSGIGLIVRGIHQGVSHYFFLGVATILLTAFMRYIDLIGDYIGGAILFMVLAAVLLGAAKYWKGQQLQGGTQ